MNGSIRAADTKRGVDALDGRRRFVVKPEVSRLLRLAHPEVDVRLVPHFEVPARDLRLAVAIDQMLRKATDQLPPFLPIAWRRHDRFVPERMKRRLGRQLPRHEAQLDKRTDAIRQQT